MIWCTGFRPALDHLQSLDMLEADGKIAVDAPVPAKSMASGWSAMANGPVAASATLIGVTRTARAAQSVK